MTGKGIPTYTLFFALLLISRKTDEWIIEKHKDYNLCYTPVDQKNKKDYEMLIEKGMARANAFFGARFKKQFDVFVHPNRQSLDSTWRKDWNEPNFKSECWMVASGVGSKLDLLSGKTWDKEACEHSYVEGEKTQQLITHELIHVFHGQLNASPDFSNVEGLDWFVEGLATYASGQCDSSRIAEIKKSIAESKIPNNLDKFWAGKLRYGLSGSIVMYIDKKYGRDKLKGLLAFNKKAELLSSLKTTEAELLEEWKHYVIQL